MVSRIFVPTLFVGLMVAFTPVQSLAKMKCKGNKKAISCEGIKNAKAESICSKGIVSEKTRAKLCTKSKRKQQAKKRKTERKKVRFAKAKPSKKKISKKSKMKKKIKSEDNEIEDIQLENL